MEGDPILGRPAFTGPECTGCAKCVAICPGLAVTMVDKRKTPDRPVVTVAYEQGETPVLPDTMVLATDADGNPVGNFRVIKVNTPKFADRTRLVRLETTPETCDLIAGIRTQDPTVAEPIETIPPGDVADDVIICRCEHITAGEIRQSIREGTRDINEMKASLRVCMGACCGKNCPEHIDRLFRQEGIEGGEVTRATTRPLFVEVPFGVFARGGEEGGEG
jgi:ferredoxin